MERKQPVKQIIFCATVAILISLCSITLAQNADSDPDSLKADLSPYASNLSVDKSSYGVSIIAGIDDDNNYFKFIGVLQSKGACQDVQTIIPMDPKSHPANYKKFICPNEEYYTAKALSDAFKKYKDEEVFSLIPKLKDVDVILPEDIFTPLTRAVMMGNISVVDMLLGRKAEVNFKNEDGTTAIHHVTSFTGKDRTIAKRLVKGGADVNATYVVDGKGYSVVTKALSVSAFDGRISYLNYLLAHGANPLLIPSSGDSPEQAALHMAEMWSGASCVLINYGVSSENLKSNCKEAQGVGGYIPILNTPDERLLEAAFAGDTDAAFEALHEGANIVASNGQIPAPIISAIFNKDEKLFNELLKRGIDPNYNDRLSGATLLMEAAAKGSPSMVFTLLQKGAAIDPKDSRGNTAMMYAQGRMNVDRLEAEHVMSLLVKGTKGQQVLKNDPDIEFKIKQAADKDDGMEIKNLITKDFDLNAVPSAGNPILFYTLVASAEENPSFCKPAAAEALLSLGANPNVLNERGISYLFQASHTCDAEFVKMLLDYKADPNLKNRSGFSATDIISQLLKVANGTIGIDESFKRLAEQKWIPSRQSYEKNTPF